MHEQPSRTKIVVQRDQDKEDAERVHTQMLADSLATKYRTGILGNAESSNLGHVDGRNVGRVEGSNVGHVEGKNVSHVEGRNVGRVDGSNVGHVEAINVAHVEGRNVGRVEGSNLGHVEGSNARRVEGSIVGANKGSSGVERAGIVEAHTLSPAAQSRENRQEQQRKAPAIETQEQKAAPLAGTRTAQVLSQTLFNLYLNFHESNLSHPKLIK